MYELIFFSISFNILVYSIQIYEIIIILLILFNSIFEAVLGLSIIIIVQTFPFLSTYIFYVYIFYKRYYILLSQIIISTVIIL